MASFAKKHLLILLLIFAFSILTLIYDKFHSEMKPFTKNTVRFCNVKKLKNNFSLDDEIKCVPTKTKPPIDLCIHPPEIDIYISQRILTHGYHEKPIADAIVRLMQKHPSAGLLDLGANIGKTCP